jgi:purine-nucleoside phosphorylase
MKLLLAAFPPELGDLLVHPPEGWVCACTDVGALAAAVAAARLIRELQPERVMFLGTCGTYDPAVVPVGALVAVAEAVATSMDELAGRGFRPQVERTRWSAGFRPPLPAHPVAVTPSITTATEGARLLAGIAPLEHLELSGVMEACREADVPCGAALAVVNEVGPLAHAQWLANHADGSARLVAALRAAGFFG